MAFWGPKHVTVTTVLIPVCLTTVQRKQVTVDTTRWHFKKFGICPAQKIYLFRKTVLPDTTRRSPATVSYATNCCTLFRRTWNFQQFVCLRIILILTVKRGNRGVVGFRNLHVHTNKYERLHHFCSWEAISDDQSVSHMSTGALFGTDKAEPIQTNFLLYTFTFVYIM